MGNKQNKEKSIMDNTTNTFKRFVIACLTLSFVLLGCLIALLYVYDPLQLYHKPYFREVAFSDDMRVQDKGIIKNYDFDSFILGTSMVMSTSAKEAGKKLGGKWVNVSLAGSHFNERAVVLRYVFSKHKVKHIIYSFDAEIAVENLVANTSNFDFLYDNNEFNDIKIYLNQKYILCALRFSTNEKCVGTKDLETLVYWATRPDEKVAFGGFHKWFKRKRPAVQKLLNDIKNTVIIPPYELKQYNKPIENNQKNINDNIIYFIKQYPQTEFSFIVPPYSRLRYRFTSPEFLAQFEVILKWFVLETYNLPNAKIYGFDDLSYADDIANYSDWIHYNLDMNSMQLDAIANGTHILTPQNIDEYLQTMENKIKAYDLTPLIEELKKYEASQKANQ